MSGRCGECEYRDLCGGCRARALASSGDPLAEDPWCTYIPGTDEPQRSLPEVTMIWTPEAEARMKKVPFFVRRMVRSAVEAFARRQGAATITPDLLQKARQRMVKP